MTFEIHLIKTEMEIKFSLFELFENIKSEYNFIPVKYI